MAVSEWGYCYVCAFEVAAEDSVLLPHTRNAQQGNKYTCPGGGRPATEQPGPEAKPIKLVSLTKSYSHLTERKRRQEAFAKAKAAAMNALRELSP